MTEERTKTEDEILFPEIEVEGIKVRPWSFGQLADMGSVLFQITSEARKMGLKPSELEERLPELLMIAAPLIPEVISKTTKIPREEIRSWEPEKGITVMVAIIQQNADKLKNLFGLSSTLTVTAKTANG